jgi:hypothetical protein
MKVMNAVRSNASAVLVYNDKDTHVLKKMKIPPELGEYPYFDTNLLHYAVFRILQNEQKFVPKYFRDLDKINSLTVFFRDSVYACCIRSTGSNEESQDGPKRQVEWLSIPVCIWGHRFPLSAWRSAILTGF